METTKEIHYDVHNRWKNPSGNFTTVKEGGAWTIDAARGVAQRVSSTSEFVESVIVNADSGKKIEVWRDGKLVPGIVDRLRAMIFKNVPLATSPVTSGFEEGVCGHPKNCFCAKCTHAITGH